MRAIITSLHTSNAAIIIRTTTVEETREQRGNGRLDRSPLLQFAFFVNLNLAILMVDIHRQLRLLPYITTIKQHSCKLPLYGLLGLKNFCCQLSRLLRIYW